ncbi:MAG: hypothetical protein K2X08_03510 [Chlamydiales bacterium]|nr:hypothetical protein [Chlamydiales bacterium]
MNIKKYAFTLFVFGALLTSHLWSTTVLVEAQGAYYYPMDHPFRRIYSSSGIYGVELSLRSWSNLYSWASGSVFTKSGHSLGLKDHTRITFVPIGIGLKYMWKVGFADVYLGAGVLPTYLNIHNDSHCLTKKMAQWGCGGIGKLGAIFNLPQSFFLSSFINYSYIKISNHNRQDCYVAPYSPNLSGFSFGASVGYRFGPR